MKQKSRTVLTHLNVNLPPPLLWWVNTCLLFHITIHCRQGCLRNQVQEKKLTIDVAALHCRYRWINRLITQQSGCSLKELNLYSDATRGSIQNNIHCALFWHECGMLQVSFSKICQETIWTDAQLDRNDGKEIKCDFCWYMYGLSEYYCKNINYNC